MERITINISGEIYELDAALVRNKKLNKLTELYNEAVETGNTKNIFICRPPGTFGAILTYVLTGRLHLPSNVCPRVFEEELEFWNIDSGILQDCCHYKLQAFTDEEKTRQTFFTHIKKQLHNDTVSFGPNPSMATKVRAKLWNLLDNNENSILAKLYFGFVFCMVTMSIICIALGTDPNFRRSLYACEVLDYLDQIDDPALKAVEEFIGNPECNNGLLSWVQSDPSDGHDDEDPPPPPPNDNGTARPQPPGDGGDSQQRATGGDQKTQQADTGSQPIIKGSTEGPPVVPGADKPQTTGGDSDQAWNGSWTIEPKYGEVVKSLEKMYIEYPHIPKLTVPNEIVVYLDMFVIAFFSLDFLLRLISHPSLKKYFTSLINLFDAMAVISSYLYILIVSLNRSLRYTNSEYLLLLNALQIFRVFRLFRIVKDVRASKVLAYSIVQDLRDMSLLAILLFICVSSFANLIYLTEGRDTIHSIPMAWYWAIITMTTVGYGDISPRSPLGHGLASLCAISGVLLLAVTLPMFVNNFLSLYQYSCVHESLEKKKKNQQKVWPEKIRVIENEKTTELKTETIYVEAIE